MFAYVVLHYRTPDITKECVDRLLKNFPESKIVIVDNFSGDGSGEMLRAFYKERANLSVVINTENLGFAKGNNTGYKFVKDNYNVDYMVVMNNDVYIDQTDFECLTENFCEENGFDIIGADILTPDGKHQNPLLKTPFSSFRIFKQAVIDFCRLLCLKTGIFEKKILAQYSKVSVSYKKETELTEVVEDCILHGSCVVFARKWIENEDFAFLPVTFLYGEEMLLYDFAAKKGYKTAVCPALKVLHLGGKSALTELNAKEKQIFKTKMALKADYEILKRRFLGLN